MLILLISLIGLGFGGMIFMQYILYREMKKYRLDFISTFDSSFKEKVKEYYLAKKMDDIQVEIVGGKVKKYMIDRNY